jgi:hypothetical protein
MPDLPAKDRYRPAQEGWVIFIGNGKHHWHHLRSDWTTWCRPTLVVNPSHVLEWRPEPGPRYEVCRDCSKRMRRAGKGPLGMNDAEAIDEQLRDIPLNDEPEPEVLVPEDNAPSPPPPPPKETPVSDAPAKPRPAPHRNGTPVPAPTGMSFVTASQFADDNRLDYRDLLAFIKEQIPDMPRLGAGAKAYHILDQDMRFRVLNEFPKWLHEKLNAKPKTQHEQLLERFDELKQLVLMLAEDVAKLAKEKTDA